MPLKSTKHTLRRCMRKLMREKYLRRITVNDICEASGISRRTFYRYYPDKYALFEDTYFQEFYNKLNIGDGTGIYLIYELIITQMYAEPEFFTHAIEAKEQNGFWELMCGMLVPYAETFVSSDPLIDETKHFMITKDVEASLHIIERWVLRGFDKSPTELAEFIRMSSAIHGKWEYQIAMGREADPYSLKEFESGEW